MTLIKLIAGAALGLYLLITAGIDVARGITRAMWPTVTGTIVASTLEDGPYYRSRYIRLSYAYRVEGKEYVGRSIHTRDDLPFTIREAQELIGTKYRSSHQVKVYYDPLHPDIAFLEPRPTVAELFWFFFGLFLLAVSVPILASKDNPLLAFRLRRKGDQSPAAANKEAFLELRRLVRNIREERRLNSDAEAFIHLCLKHFLNLADEQIPGAITHGWLDGGIDAVHIDDEGVHIVACDYAKSWLGSKLPMPIWRLELFIRTWLAIAASHGGESWWWLNSRLRRKIPKIRAYWARFDSYIPHTFYFFTNRNHAGIPRADTEHRMNYFMDFTYRYYEQKELAEALLNGARIE